VSPTTSTPNQQLRTRILIAITVVSGLCCIFMVAWNWLPKRRVPTPVYRTEPIVNSVAFSVDRDSKYLAAVLSDGRVRLWETESKKELPVKLPSRLALHDLTWNIADGWLRTACALLECKV
jgi:WD40 repeat protein